MTEGTLHGILKSRAGACRDRIAFSFFKDRWESITYGEFLRKTEAIASYFLSSGIREGDRVSIISENRPEWCAAYLGVLTAGGVAVPMDTRLTPQEIRNILVDSETKLVIHSSETREPVREAAGGLSVHTLNLDEFDYEGMLSPEDIRNIIKPDDIASLLYTSGTTGTPKAVMLTHRNLLSDAEAITKAGIITGEDNVLSVLPLHHTYPFMCTFVVPVLSGARITYPAGMKGPEIVSAIKETAVTVVVGVPQLLELMRNRILERIKTGRWLAFTLFRLSGYLRRTWDINLMRVFSRPFGNRFRFFASGGARLDPEVMKDMEALGFTVLEGYGLTETSPVVTFNPVEKRKPGSVGKPLPSVQIKITGKGEIAIKGPMLMKGYYKRPEETASAIKDGWFLSGDLGYLDEDGYLFITGRLKELIVLSSGKNVYPEEVENHYLKSPLVKEMCVTGHEDRLQAVVVPDVEYARDRKIGNIKEAIGWEIMSLSNSLPPHMRIKGYTLHTGPLPRTPLGKLKRFMIKDTDVKTTKEQDKTLIADETGRAVIECLRPLVTEAAQVQASDSLEIDLRLDSLKRLELAVSLEEALSVSLPEHLLYEVQTVGELVSKLKELKVPLQAAAGDRSAALKEEFAAGLDAVLWREPPEDEKKMLEAGTASRTVAVFLKRVIKLIFRAFFGLQVTGVENLPLPPFIIASNHASYLDSFVIASGLPPGVFKSLYYQGIQKYFSGRLTSWGARFAQVIPIDPDIHLNKALQLSSYILRNGNCLCIFPEGGRSFDGNIAEFKKGIGMLALKLNVPVVPARIKGTFKILPRGAAWPRRGRIRLAFGRPFSPLDSSLRPEGVDEYRFFADELRKRVIDL